MATRNKLYEVLTEKLSDWFKKHKSWAHLPPEVKDAAKKDPKIKKQLDDIEKRAEKIKKDAQKALSPDW
jgi:predicted  nucleic acid-binding Zn-ribbon protein